MQAGSEKGNGHSPAPVSSPGGTGAAPSNGNGHKNGDKKPMPEGRRFPDGKSGNAKGYPKGIPHRNTMLQGAVRGWTVEEDLAKLIESKLKIKTKGKSFDRVLLKIAFAKFVMGDDSLLRMIMGYQFLPLSLEACGIVDPAAVAAGASGHSPGNNLNFTLNAFEQALQATAPVPTDRGAFGEGG